MADEQQWHDADAVVEASEASENDAIAEAARRRGEASEGSVVEQSGDSEMAGSAEADAWTPGSSTGGRVEEPAGSDDPD